MLKQMSSNRAEVVSIIFDQIQILAMMNAYGQAKTHFMVLTIGTNVLLYNKFSWTEFFTTVFL